MNRPYAPYEVEQIAAMIRAGAPVPDIADRFGRSIGAIRKLSAARRLSVHSGMAARRERATARRDRIIREGWGKWPLSEIARSSNLVRVEAVLARAADLGLPADAYQGNGQRSIPTATPRRSPWPQETVAWARANPTHPEARIIAGEMARLYSRIPAGCLDNGIDTAGRPRPRQQPGERQ